MEHLAKHRLQKLTTAVILLMFISFDVFAQNRSVTGRVTNSSGEPLPGATISVVGSTGGTSAGTDGAFTISVPANARLRVSAVGFAEQEKSVGNQPNLTFIMQPANSQLEQVVVVGYGTQRKKDVTGAVASVNMD